MSKRNLILLTILIFIFILVVYVARRPDVQVNFEEPASENVNFFSNFFNNFTRSNNTGDGKPVVDMSDSGNQDDGFVVPEMLSLRKVSSMPIAGFGILKKEVYIYVEAPKPNTEEGEEGEQAPSAPATEYKTTVRYVDKSNGHIYQSEAGKNDERKYSEAVMPGIHEAFFGKNGSAVVLRYLAPGTEIIETFIRELPAEVLGADLATESKINGNFLPQNITDIAIKNDGENIFYLTNSRTSAVGTTANALGTNKNQIFESAYTEWLSQWPNENLVTLTTKPASGVPGYMYAVNPKLKDFNKIIGGINGLTTLTSPNGSLVLVANDRLDLSLFDVNTGEIKSLGIRTLPEKCVWGKSSDVVFCAVPRFVPFGNHPDSWYKGLYSFNDNIWQISVNDGQNNMLVNILDLVNENIDAIRLSISEDGKYLYFMDKKSSFLWELRLK